MVGAMRKNGQSLSIVHINTHDIAGGAAKVAWRLAEAQRNAGHDSRMLVGHKRSKSEYCFSFPIEADSTIQARCRREGQLFYEFQGSHKLVNNPLVRSADILHLHNLHGGYFNPFSISALSFLKPVVWTLHDMQSITGHCAHSFDCQRWQNGCGQCPYLGVEPALGIDTTEQLLHDKRLVYDHSYLQIVTPSQWLKNKVERSVLRNHPVELIYNGIDTNIFRPYNKIEARKKFDIPQDVFVIGAVGHGGPLANQWKGGNYTQAALDALQNKLPDCIFVNIGGNYKADNLRIFNIPHIENETELAQAYSALDIFLYTPVADNCPLVVLEALACGIPIATFNTGGIPELVRDKIDGYVSEHKNVYQLVQSVEALAADSKLRVGFSRNARKQAALKFEQKIIYERCIDLYHRCINEHSSGVRKPKLFPVSEVPKTIVTHWFLEAEYSGFCIGVRSVLDKRGIAPCQPSDCESDNRITVKNFPFFTYSKNSHFAYFKNNGLALYNKKIDKDDCDLKVYQDLLIYTFILENITKGSKILEIGGGNSRILRAIRKDMNVGILTSWRGSAAARFPLALTATVL